MTDQVARLRAKLVEGVRWVALSPRMVFLETNIVKLAGFMMGHIVPQKNKK
jgi:hypothetical protein